MNNNVLVNADTDSIMIAKPDGSPWSKEEQEVFMAALNAEFPELINWDHDGVFTRVVVVKSKNYALLPEGETKIKTKGSSIRDQKKEPALREMMEKMIRYMIEDKADQLVDVYHDYIREAVSVQDIGRWAQKKTITDAITDCEGWTVEDIKAKRLRTNETVVWEAIKNEDDRQAGNKIYLYPAVLSSSSETTTLKNGKVKVKVTKETGLKLTKYWTSDHDSDKLVERVYSTLSIFDSILDMDKFIDYGLVKNKKLLEDL